MVEQTGRDEKRIGNYRLVRLLGRGGFAEVFLAEHIHLNTPAAIKLLNTRLAGEGIEGFRNEARMIAGLIHPHIVRVLDFGVEEGVPYLVMDYASNGTLRQRHPKGSRLPLQLVVNYVQQIAGALQYAHGQRLIHRDIKPENMLVGRSDEVLLSDFGIALVAQSSVYQKTQDVAGTLVYMAPEQIQAHPRPASDQYSLGIVVYEWLGGQRPFQGTMTEIAVKHATAVPPSLRLSVPDLPPAVEHVVLTALQKDPHQRFPTVLAFAQALEQASQQAGQSFAGGYATASSNFSQAGPPPPPSYAVYSNAQPGGYPQPPSSYPAYSNPQASSAQQPGGYFQPPSLYPAYPNPQGSSAQAGSSSLPAKGQRVSRRAAISVIAGSTVAIAGSGLTYYAYTHWRSGASGLSGASSLVKTGVKNAGPSSTSTSTVTGTSSTAPLLRFNDHTKTVWAVSWSPDGKYIASASDDGTSHVWSSSTQQRLLSYRSRIQPAQSDDRAVAVAWAPNSSRIAVGFSDGTAQIVDLISRQQIGSYDSSTNGDLPGSLYGVSISPNGRFLALAGFFSNDIQIFDIAAQSRIHTLSGHTDTVYAVSWSHNGRYIASGSSDSTVRVWDGSTGKLLLVYTEQSDDIRAISWSPDDKHIVSGGINGQVFVWTSDAGQTLLTYGNPNGFEVLATAWSHGGKYIASAGGNDANLQIWNAQNGKLLHVLPSGAAYSLSWSPDDTRIATANDTVVQVWQV